MATKALKQCRIVGDIAGNTTNEVRVYKEASSQSFSAGSLVYLASGYLTACADDAVTILGIANKAATGTSASSIPVTLITPTTLLSICAYHATSASAITAQADVGVKRPIEVVGSNYYIQLADTTSASCVVIGLDPEDEVGDVYGKYLVTVMAACCQTTIGA